MKPNEHRYRIAIQRFGTKGLTRKPVEFRNITLISHCSIDTLQQDIINGLENKEGD